MPNDKEHFVGIDVSKDTLDLAVLGKKPIQQFANTKRGIAQVVGHMKQIKPKLIVVEATGGYEEALARACSKQVCSEQQAPTQTIPVPRTWRKPTSGCPDPGGYGKAISRACLWQGRSATALLWWHGAAS
jgi:hypothetical protein